MKKHIEDLRVGQTAIVGYRQQRWPSVFQGFYLDDAGKPRAKFRDTGDDMEWEAYLFEGRFCVGSSADPLKIY